MIPFHGRRWTIKPPPSAARINWSHPITRGLVVYIPMNEGAGKILRNIAGATEATANADAWGMTTSGIGYNVGNTTGRLVTLPDSAALDVGQNHTIVCRCQIKTDANDQEICAKGTDGFELDYSAGSVRYNRDDDAVLVSTAVAANATLVRHIAAVNDNATATLYVDGQANASAGSATLSDTAIALHIGCDTTDTTKILNGIMVDFALWNRPLSAQEVLTLYLDPYVFLQPMQAPKWSRKAAAAGGRATKNTRAFPLGVNVGMGWRMPA